MIKAAMAGGAAVLCPWSGVFAQSGAGLLRAPKQALVIGNSKYKQTPLKNPVNDAQGMAGVLKSAGFGVTLGLDLTQAGIRDAIRVYSESLAKTKAVGLFYFAGHGA
ncbi:MAG TPA: caspase family protein, partial [Burkholderiales bacterium]|nr:caspase family protein [Burkholderiales bacterium]